jgi:hypothetical protein
VISHASDPVFELNDLADPFYFRVTIPDGWTVKAITIGGADVTDTKITLPHGQQAEARIVISNRATNVSGVITKAGRPVKADVVIFPADPAKWAFPTRYVRHADADDQGRFRVAGLPAYERYLAIAPEYLEEGEQIDPEFLDRVREMAFPFALGEDEARTLDLPVFER